MTIYNISNLAGLFNHFDACAADVVVEMADGKSYEWQSQKDILHSLADSIGSSQIGQLQVRCQDKTDVVRIMDYLMECKHGNHALSA